MMQKLITVLVAVLVVCAVSSCAMATQSSKQAFITTLDLSHKLSRIPIDVYYPSAGDAPYPIVIDMHGCSGIIPARRDGWVNRLNRWGYAVIKVDSFTPRGDNNICDDLLKISPLHRLNDIAGAMDYIAQNQRLDTANVFIMGMSHGGTTVLLSNYQPRDVFRQLRGIIAYYPYCIEELPVLVANTLIVIGEDDDWTPAAYCQRMKIRDRGEYDLQLVVYPNTWHSFDVPGTDQIYHGYQLRHNPVAAKDSFKRVREFLRIHTIR